MRLTEELTRSSVVDDREDVAEQLIENERGQSDDNDSTAWSSDNDDYRKLFEECKNKLNEETEKFQKRVIRLTVDYEELKERYDDLEETSKNDFGDMKINYENAIEEKDKLIASQRKIIEEYDAKYVKLQD